MIYKTELERIHRTLGYRMLYSGLVYIIIGLFGSVLLKNEYVFYFGLSTSVPMAIYSVMDFFKEKEEWGL